MTITTETVTSNKVNRFKTLHHHLKTNPAFYTRFETAVAHVLKSVPDIISARVLRDTLSRDFPSVGWTVDGVDVFKALLSWFRYKNPGAESHFRFRKTERGRATGLNRRAHWRHLARVKVSYDAQILPLVEHLRATQKVTTMVLLKAATGVRFNQNYNSEVADYIRSNWTELAQYLPARRPLVR